MKPNDTSTAMPKQDSNPYRFVPSSSALRYIFQAAYDWAVEAFGIDIVANIPERSSRFLEEALELVQSLDLPREFAHRLVDYVYDRPKGEVEQEVAGTLVTLGTLCGAKNVNAETAVFHELVRVTKKIDVIRAKQRSKKAQGVGVGDDPDAALPGWSPKVSHRGWLYFNPDTGLEYTDSHPIDSGECPDAENILEATESNLKNALFDAWDNLRYEKERREALEARL